MFPCDSGERVAADAAQESDQFLIVARDAAYESVPDWTLSTRPNRSDLGRVSIDPRQSHLAGVQIEYSGGRVQEPRISIPLVTGRGEPPVGLGEPIHSGNGLGARNSHPNARIIRLS